MFSARATALYVHECVIQRILLNRKEKLQFLVFMCAQRFQVLCHSSCHRSHRHSLSADSPIRRLLLPHCGSFVAPLPRRCTCMHRYALLCAPMSFYVWGWSSHVCVRVRSEIPCHCGKFLCAINYVNAQHKSGGRSSTSRILFRFVVTTLFDRSAD